MKYISGKFFTLYCTLIQNSGYLYADLFNYKHKNNYTIMKNAIISFVSLISVIFFTGCGSATKVGEAVNITLLPNGEITSMNESRRGGAQNLIDGENTKFMSFISPTWVQYKSPKPYILTKYTLTSCDEAPDRDPSSWTLEGSLNGVTYYAIDSRSDQKFENRSLKKEYIIKNNKTAYTYYRLNLTNDNTIVNVENSENSGGGRGANFRGLIQLAGLELLGYEGKPSTNPFADFTVVPFYATESPIAFTNASVNATSYKWTFTGAEPSTSTSPNPKVFYKTPGNYTVKLEVSNGSKSASKTIDITVKDANDWSSFIYPEVTLTCANKENPGYIKYLSLAKANGFNSLEEFVQDRCLFMAKALYYSVDEANAQNLRKIHYKLNEGGALSYKGGDVPNIEIGFDMGYLNGYTSRFSDSICAAEINGVLLHELCHGYQKAPRGAGGYSGGTEYFGYLEGMADLARILTGGFAPTRYPRAGGHWYDGYNVTGFFYQWIYENKSKTFLKDLNRSAITINPWTLDAATQELFGESAQSLWDAYQKSLEK